MEAGHHIDSKSWDVKGILDGVGSVVVNMDVG